MMGDMYKVPKLTIYNGNFYILVEMNINCDEFGGMGMLLKTNEWVSYAETEFFRLDD